MHSVHNLGRSVRAALAATLIISSLLAVETSARADAPASYPTPVCSIVDDTCRITFSNPNQVQQWVAPSWLNSVTISIAGGVGGSAQIDDSTNSWSPTVVEPFYAITTIGDIDLNESGERSFNIAVGSGGSTTSGGINPIEDYSGGDAGLFTGASSADEHKIGGGGAATVVSTDTRTFVLAGTAGASKRALKGSTVSGTTNGDQAKLIGSIGSGQYFGGGGGGFFGGIAGSSGTSQLAGLARYTGIEYRDAGSTGYVTFEYAAPQLPSAPSIESIDPNNHSLSVNFEGTEDFSGPNVLNYAYSLDSGVTWTTRTPASVSSPLVIQALTNGLSYPVKIRAINEVGASTGSDEVSAIPRTVSAAPTISAVTSTNNNLIVSYLVGTNGGSLVTNFQYSTNSGLTWTSVSPAQTTSPLTISGLIAGTEYSVALRAVNAAGVGAASNIFRATPITIASAPVLTSVTPSDQQLAVAFTVPTSDGSSLISNYQYSVNGGTDWLSYAPSSTSSPLVLSGLVNGTSYSVKLRAVNASGNGSASNAISSTPRKIANAPTLNSATSSGGNVYLAFTGSTENGGSAITNYEYSSDGGTSWSALSPSQTSGQITVAGLIVGTQYEFKLRAVTGAGSGLSSSAKSVTVITTASAPVLTSVTPSDQQLTVAFNVPSLDGSSSITNYQYSLNGGTDWVSYAPSSTSSPLVISGLQNGSSYSVKLRAINASGNGTASNVISATPRKIANAPTLNSVTSSGGNVYVAFTGSTDNGGSAITNYEYSSDGGSTWVVLSPAQTSGQITVAGLIVGTQYDFKLRAVTGAGSGLSSSAKSVTVATSPSAPTITSIESGVASLKISYSAPINDGAKAITNYEYSIDNGTSWQVVSPATTSSPIIVSGLTNGTTYQVALRAVNGAGTGAASSTTSAKPYTTPGTATLNSVVAENNGLTISFTAPSTAGGSAITSYEYSLDEGANWIGGVSASPFFVSNVITTGDLRVQVRALNARGAGNPSAVFTKPGVAGLTSTVSGNGSLTYSISAPVLTGGQTVDHYEYSRDGGINWTTVAGIDINSPLIISGLTNGTAYILKLRAVNALGIGATFTSSSAIPRTVPDAPTASDFIVSNSKFSYIETDAANNGGSEVSRVAYSLDSGVNWIEVTRSASGSRYTVSGLTNNTAYGIKVRVGNQAGWGLPTAVTSVTPIDTVPSAPEIVSGSSANGAAILTYSVPVDNGGSVISGYQYTVNSGTTWASITPLADKMRIGGLTNGVSYALVIRAINSRGYSIGSNSVSVTPLATVPAAPQGSSVIGTNKVIEISLQSSIDNGGAAITGYEYAINGGTTWLPATYNSGYPNSVSVPNQSNDLATLIQLRAKNVVGTSAPSVYIAGFAGLRDERLVITSVSSMSQALNVIFKAPSAPPVAGAALNQMYQYSTDDGLTWSKPRKPSSNDALVAEKKAYLPIRGLVNGAIYKIKIRTAYTKRLGATYVSGWGPISSGQTAVPSDVPSAPKISSIASGNERLVVSFIAPTSNGGALITNYAYSFGGSVWTTVRVPQTNSPLIVTGLTNGRSYSIRIRAINANGFGAVSSVMVMTPRFTSP